MSQKVDEVLGCNKPISTFQQISGEIV